MHLYCIDFRNHIDSFGKNLKEVWKTKPSVTTKSPSKLIVVNDVNMNTEYDDNRITDRGMLKKFGSFEDTKNLIEDSFERLKYTATSGLDHSRDFHHSPPSYHQPQYSPPPAPSYHPPPYKAVYEVISYLTFRFSMAPDLLYPHTWTLFWTNK